MDVVSATGTRITPRTSRGRGWRFWGVTVAILVFELSTWCFAIGSVIAHRDVAPNPGWTSQVRRGVWTVKEVDAQGPAKDLSRGDEVLSVRGEPLSWLGPNFRILGTYPGQSYTVTVKRYAQRISFRLRMGTDSSISLLDVWPNLFIASLLFLSGLWMRLGGPGDMTSRLGSATFLGASIGMLGPVLLLYPGWSLWTAWVAIFVARLPRPIVVVVGWDFLSRFPTEMHEGRTIRLLRRSFYATAFLLWVAIILPVLVEFCRLPNVSFLGWMEWLGWDGPASYTANEVFDGIISFATCCVLVHNYRLLTDRDSRRRIRWAAVSFGIGAICLLALRLFGLLASISRSPIWDTATNFADTAWTLAIGFLPIALTYAVVKHRVLDIQLVIRRGVQYLLAKNVLRLIIFAPVLIVLIQILREPNQSISDLVFRSSWRFYLLVMGTAAFSLRYRRQFSRWLDRRFFRVALQEEEAWVALAESMKSATTEREIADAVAHQVEMALPVNGMHILFRSPSDGRLNAAYSSSFHDAQKLCKELEEDRARTLAGNSVFMVAEPNSDSASSIETDEELLVVPLLRNDGQNLGAFVLGPKKSEQPYTRKERELLEAVAAQVAMACEVLRLKRSIDYESRQRIAVLGRLDRENIQLLNECLSCGNCYDASMRQCPIDGSLLELTLPVERIIVGRYRLDRRLGAGGMGVVYQAVDLRLQKLVAVKIMTGELFGNRQALVRFRREAQAVASLRHPNIAGVHDFGQLPAEGAFLVMDLVNGFSWRRHLQFANPLAPERVASWVEDLCAGVAAAHSSGVVHRDLKPENVMISSDGGRETAMILDFGLAKLHSDAEKEGINVSVSGTIVGTRSYMSPEQRSGERVGTATDVYAAAVMALETLSRLGPPYAGVTTEWADKALERIVGPDSNLRAIFRLALAETPEARIQKAEKFGRVLSAAIRSERLRMPIISGSDDAETLSLGAVN